MLILTRKNGEGIILGDNIELTVLETHDGKVKIGINAPNDVKILRSEVRERVLEENKSAKAKVLDKAALAELVNKGR